MNLYMYMLVMPMHMASKLAGSFAAVFDAKVTMLPRFAMFAKDILDARSACTVKYRLGTVLRPNRL